MLSFRRFLIESYLILENKRQDFINRFLKIHSDHPLVQNNPEQAGSLIAHSMSFGQNADEHHFLTRQLLDGTYKPGEDESTIQMTLGKWRKAKQKNLVSGSLKDHTHDSVSALFRDIPQLRTKTTTQHRGLEELAKYHIGEIEHPELGTLQVHHVHHSDIPVGQFARTDDAEEYKRISAALRKTCEGGSSWCVLPKDIGHEYLEKYSQGSGIFFYTNKEGNTVLSHGYGDRGIVRPDNSVVDETDRDFKSEGRHIFNETNRLLSGEKKISHIISNEQYAGSERIKLAMADPSFGNDPHHMTHIINSSDESIAKAAVEHPLFGNDPDHITIALKSPHASVQKAALEHPSFGSDPNHIFYAVRSSKYSIAKAGVDHPKFGSSPRHITAAIRSNFEPIAKAGVDHPAFLGSDLTDFLKSDQLNAALRSPHEYVQKAATKHRNFGSPDSVYTALQSPFKAVAEEAVKHPSFIKDKTYDYVGYALQSPHVSLHRAAVEHPDFGTVVDNRDVNHFRYALQSPDESVARAALEHANFGSDPIHITSALRSPHEFAQRAAVWHPNFGIDEFDHIYHALRSPHESVVRAAIEHPNFGNDHSHITAALDSDHEFAQRAAVEHPNFGVGDYHMGTALQSVYEPVAIAATKHRYFLKTPDYIQSALRSPHESVARAAIEHPGFSSWSIPSALESRHEAVALAAVNHKSFKRAAPNDIKLALTSPYESVRTAARKAQIQI